VDDNDFAVALYGQLQQRPGNLFFSPLSVRSALAMALAGARGETSGQMSKALCFVASGEEQQRPISYVQARGYQAVELDYRGGDLSLLVLLPDRRDGLADLEKRLSATLLHDTATEMSTRDVELYLPRFRITSDAMNLRDPLTALGMPLAFERSRADFSGIDGHAPPDEEALFIAAVRHKAFVEVNEAGTEAAAATAMPMPLSASMAAPKPPPVPVFRADHPFVFAIRDRRSGAISFLGRMADPTRASGTVEAGL
jgi:serpin B